MFGSIAAVKSSTTYLIFLAESLKDAEKTDCGGGLKDFGWGDPSWPINTFVDRLGSVSGGTQVSISRR